MLQKLHKNARTNYAIRLAIKKSSEPILHLANKYRLSWQTVKKWKERESNGCEFTYKALAKKTKKIHPFDQICLERKIQHRTIKFKHPWTNGMVERFNQKVKNKVFKRYLFAGVDNLKEKLTDYLNLYNFEVKLRQLNYQTPANYLKERFNYLVQRIVI